MSFPKKPVKRHNHMSQLRKQRNTVDYFFVRLGASEQVGKTVNIREDFCQVTRNTANHCSQLQLGGRKLHLHTDHTHAIHAVRASLAALISSWLCSFTQACMVWSYGISPTTSSASPIPTDAVSSRRHPCS